MSDSHEEALQEMEETHNATVATLQEEHGRTIRSESTFPGPKAKPEENKMKYFQIFSLYMAVCHGGCRSYWGKCIVDNKNAASKLKFSFAHL